MTETVWLLIEQEDYESVEVNSVYSVKPTVFTLMDVLKSKFSHLYGPEVIRDLAYKLWDGEVRLASLNTWRLEERELM
jgi:hypothetical protein